MQRSRDNEKPDQWPQRIFLVGLMGVGKTTVGQQLAKRLGMAFVDSDKEIERRTGANIPLIFELEGEEGFRNRETAVIDDLTRRDGIVLATGGGAVLRAENRQWLHNRGRVVFLHASVDRLLERTHRDRNRPLLRTDDPRAKLEELIAVREPLYREVAHLTLETGDRTVRHVVQDIIKRLRAMNKADRAAQTG